VNRLASCLVAALALAPATAGAFSPPSGPFALPPEQLGEPDEPRPIRGAKLRRGDLVEVLWHGAWYDAEVLATRAGLTKIHYIGDDASWDEWVEPDRIRRAPRIDAAPVNTDALQVEWGGTWWDAQVLAQRGGRVKIRYVGWGPEWDEWVAPSRLRAAPTEPHLCGNG
jgi:hypothetical protein